MVGTMWKLKYDFINISYFSFHISLSAMARGTKILNIFEDVWTNITVDSNSEYKPSLKNNNMHNVLKYLEHLLIIQLKDLPFCDGLKIGIDSDFIPNIFKLVKMYSYIFL